MYGLSVPVSVSLRSFSVSVISWLWVQGFRSLTLLTEFGPNSGLDDGWALISLCWIGSFNWAWFCFRSLFCVHERLGWHCRVWVQTVTVGLSLFPLTDGSGCWIGSRRIVTDLMWQHWGNLAGEAARVDSCGQDEDGLVQTDTDHWARAGQTGSFFMGSVQLTQNLGLVTFNMSAVTLPEHSQGAQDDKFGTRSPGILLRCDWPVSTAVPELLFITFLTGIFLFLAPLVLSLFI